MSDIRKDLGITAEERKRLDEEIEQKLAEQPAPTFFARVQEEIASQGLDVPEPVKGIVLRNFKLAEITVGEKRRPVDDGKVEELMGSIDDVGLLHPITVTPAKRLVAGLHRKVACERLGWTEITCVVKGYDVLHAELAEIDENLVRNDLKALEYGEQLARRKRVYLALHPETEHVTKRGGPGRGKKTERASRAVSFVEDTAAKTGVHPATVKRDVQIADGICQDVRDKLRKHEVADNKAELLKLARVRNEGRQRDVAKLLSSGEVKNVTDALRVMRLRERHDRNAATSTENPKLDGAGVLYNVVYADPAWQYEHSISVSRDIEEQYPTMPLEDICDMPVESVITEDAMLFIWCPPSLIKHGLQVIERWGFEYRTMLVWDKESPGMGYWVRQQVELLLIAVRGKPPTPETKDRPPSILRCPKRKHSQKPDEAAAIIEKMYPKQAKLELFARAKRKGWTCWGNQVAGVVE